MRVRGLGKAQDPVHVSAALTLEFGVQVIVTTSDIAAGLKYVSVPEAKFKEMFAPASARRYHSTEHGWVLDFESKQANGDPFHLPLLSPTKEASAKQSKNLRKPKPKTGPANKRKIDHTQAEPMMTPSTMPPSPSYPPPRSVNVEVSPWGDQPRRSHVANSPLPGKRNY